MRDNIIIDKHLQRKMQDGCLLLSDHLLLSLADFTAGLFPEMYTYIGAQQQGVVPPAVWVAFYDIANRQKLHDTSQYDFGVEITYWPADSKSQAEISGAVFLLEQNLHVLPCDTGDFLCYSKNSDITDGIGHVTASIAAREITIDDAPIIRKAEKEVKPID